MFTKVDQRVEFAVVDLASVLRHNDADMLIPVAPVSEKVLNTIVSTSKPVSRVGQSYWLLVTFCTHRKSFFVPKKLAKLF